MADKAITLSEILARGVAMEWHEGVAIVRALTAQLLEGDSTEPRFPDLTQIDVSPEGTVVVVGGRPSPEPVRRLGQLLQATLGQGEPPVQLRLFITQATAPTPTFDNMRAFDESLSYYERPNREAVLRRLYERVNAAPAAAAVPETTLDAIAPLPEPERAAKSTPKPKKTARNRRPLWIGTAAALLVVASVAAFEIAKSTGRLENIPATATLIDSASTKLGDSVMSGLSAVSDTIGLGRLVPASDPPGPAPGAVRPEDKKPKAAGRPATATMKSVTPIVETAAGPEPGSATQAAAAVHAPEPRFTAYDLDVPAPSDGRGAKSIELHGNHAATASGQVSITEVSARVFSTGSVDVVPPVGIRPKLSRQLPTNRSIDQLAPVEIVVGIDGSVESVKFLRTPRDVRESMLLSVIKAWQFQPASRDGVPVKYQKTVWVAPE
jgi:hypothetical protein